MAQIENQVPATPATTFRSASTLKSMTAILILQQVSAGRIDLDGEIHQYCPQYPPQRFPVTIRQLLLHQGGIRGSDGLDVLTHDYYPSVVASLGRFGHDSLRFEPGTSMLYSNYGYVLLACALEGVTGKPYDRVLRGSILDPLGMTATAPVNLYRAQPNRASSYLIRTADNTRTLEGLWTAAHLAASPLDTAFPADPVDPSFAIGAGNHLSTPSDMVRFVLALDAGKLLPDSLRRLELVAQPAPAGTTPRPIGWTTTTYGDVQVSQVFGSDWDGSFATVWDPADHLAIAVASNINWDQPGTLVAKILSVVRQVHH
jgi:CubicO group peptidase (beta-lactamase class C family)